MGASSARQVDRVFRARVDEVEETPHEILVYVVEAQGVARTALPAELEADGIVDVPFLLRFLGGDEPVHARTIIVAPESFFFFENKNEKKKGKEG